MKEELHRGTWRNEAAEKKFRAMEAKVWAEAGPPHPEALDVATSFGSTHVSHWPGSGADSGSGFGRPIVLLHGMGDTSVRWVPWVKALEGHDVYGPELMGDVGRSRHDVGFASTRDYGVWLDETLRGLDLGPVHLVGMSLGGYVALELAAQHPERVASLTLIEPVGIGEIRPFKFMSWGMKGGLAALAPTPIRRWMARRLRQPALADKTEARMLLHGQMSHPPAIRVIETLDDETLDSITAPVTLLLGRDSEAFDPEAVTERAERCLANVTTEIVPDAGHAVGLTHLDLCVARLKDVVATGEVPRS